MYKFSAKINSKGSVYIPSDSSVIKNALSYNFESSSVWVFHDTVKQKCHVIFRDLVDTLDLNTFGKKLLKIISDRNTIHCKQVSLNFKRKCLSVRNNMLPGFNDGDMVDIIVYEDLDDTCKFIKNTKIKKT